MAIVFTYPPIGFKDVQPSDRLLISQMTVTGNPTRSITVNNFRQYIGAVIPANIVTGTGTTNRVTKWNAPVGSGEIEDSANLKFTGSDLIVGTGVTANNSGVIVSGVTTSISFVGPLTGNSTTATDLSINATQRLVLQTGNNATDVLASGNAGQVLQSAGSGNAPAWVNAAAAGAIEGITVRQNGSVVGSANSISTLNFLGNAVSVDAAVLAGIATVTIEAEDPVAMAIALG